jgi:hypothetical protein
VGGAAGIASAEALIQYASHFPHPYDQYLVGAAPVLAAVSTALLPKVTAALGVLLSAIAIYATEKYDVWTANRTIIKAKKMLKRKGVSEEERKHCEEAIRLHTKVILEAHVPMPKNRAKPQQA